MRLSTLIQSDSFSLAYHEELFSVKKFPLIERLGLAIRTVYKLLTERKQPEIMSTANNLYTHAHRVLEEQVTK